ncbi:MAG: hypothetical protein WCT37_04655, partial [Patescibacteria group bacterium]
MVDDIKKIKAEDKQEDLEKEVQEVKAGKIEITEMPALPETLEKVEEEALPVETAAVVAGAPKADRGRGGHGGHGGQGGGRGERRGGRGGGREADSEFEQKIVDLARVTRVMAGGKRMRFRACVAIGDRKGRVGLGMAKGQDVTMAIGKAVTKAKKDMVTVPFKNETIPFAVTEKFKAAQIILKPAAKGKGIIAGGALRIVLELAGVPNVAAKILGTNNKVTNAKAIMLAFKRLAG